MADIETVIRRVTSVTNHLLSTPTPPPQPHLISLSHTSSSTKNDTYQRVHGNVPSNEVVWKVVASDEEGRDFTDIVYEKSVGEGIAKISINRPERRNAFRPQTVKELIRAFNDARDDPSVGVIILTGKGTDAFCSGGDQALRTEDGYSDHENIGRLNVLDLQEMGGNATLIFYGTEEAKEGKTAYMERRRPDFSKFNRRP